MSSNKEFLDLLNSVVEDKKFTEVLTDEQEYTFKQLTTSQLRDLVKSVVDSPLIQSSFNTTISKVFKESLIGSTEKSFNVIDRTLFLLGARIDAISPEFTFESNEEKKTVDLRKHKQKLLELCVKAKFNETQTYSEGGITIEYGVPSVTVEDKLNKEIYNNEKFNVDIEKQESFRNLIGDLFINELVKCIKTLKIQETELDLNSVSFKEGIKIVEKLPASIISVILQFVESYKKTIRDALLVEKDVTIPIDGTLFSLR
jgi:hypothetical protein